MRIVCTTPTEALSLIVGLHQQVRDVGGMTSGYCAECSWQYPCPTVHLANGWGEIQECEEAGWCEHAGVPLTPPPPPD